MHRHPGRVRWRPQNLKNGCADTSHAKENAPEPHQVPDQARAHQPALFWEGGDGSKVCHTMLSGLSAMRAGVRAVSQIAPITTPSPARHVPEPPTAACAPAWRLTSKEACATCRYTRALGKVPSQLFTSTGRKCLVQAPRGATARAIASGRGWSGRTRRTHPRACACVAVAHGSGMWAHWPQPCPGSGDPDVSRASKGVGAGSAMG